jgi:hypothetical protein
MQRLLGRAVDSNQTMRMQQAESDLSWVHKAMHLLAAKGSGLALNNVKTVVQEVHFHHGRLGPKIGLQHRKGACGWNTRCTCTDTYYAFPTNGTLPPTLNCRSPCTAPRCTTFAYAGAGFDAEHGESLAATAA